MFSPDLLSKLTFKSLGDEILRIKYLFCWKYILAQTRKKQKQKIIPKYKHIN